MRFGVSACPVLVGIVRNVYFIVIIEVIIKGNVQHASTQYKMIDVTFL